jgi:hypothetical protein
MFNEAKYSDVNWFKWHYELQHLFCGALYNKWKCWALEGDAYIRYYGKVAYFELSSHQISELKQQAKRENLHLANISEIRAN